MGFCTEDVDGWDTDKCCGLVLVLEGRSWLGVVVGEGDGSVIAGGVGGM